MSELLTKRQHTEEFDDSFDSKKKMNKPGRKPIDTEPKNKRTAQNRAAQRAFRERKERKMKDLEDKISLLEDQKKSANTEAEFLRLQVQMLMGELAKHRDTSDISDLKLPSMPTVSSNKDTPSSDASSTFSPADSEGTNKSTISSEHDNYKAPQFSFEFPWSRKNSLVNQKSPSTANSTNNIPGLASDASTASSAESSPFELYNTDDQRDLPLFNQIKKKSLTTNKIDEFQFNDHFDEGISEFCQDLNSACGTKDCPVPKSKSQASTPLNSGMTPLPLTANRLNSIQEDPLSFLNDGNLEAQFGTFDPTLAFVHDGTNEFSDLFDENDKPEVDPIESLTTEESLYDPFGLFSNAKQSPIVETLQPSSKQEPVDVNITNKTSRTSLTKTPLEELGLAGGDESEIVPNTDGKLLKCTEIWDRITSHPKYSDIDIDGLCSELRAKAKCSDKGVVIDFADVNNVILNSIPKKKS